MKLEARADQLPLNRKDRRRLEALSGTRPYGDQLRCSDIPARVKFANLLVSEIRDLEANDPDLQFMFVTLLADEGIMSDRRPAVYLDSLLEKARRAMIKMQVDGITALEVSPLMNYPGGGAGRSLLLHVHMLIWYNPKMRLAPMPNMELVPQRGIQAWTSRFGADPIVVTPITPELGTAAYWAAYMLKAPYEAKNLVQKKKEEFYQYKMMKTIKGYRPELAMRVHELLSQLPLTALCIGTKGGATILSRCRKQVKRWAKTRVYDTPTPVAPFNERKFWERTHRQRRKRYRPFYILGPTVD
ncbi:hypothetical protein [Parafrankia sp. BMG5.11]|uniref:hypothetical protein n=1 Tax=Parafrankia sp. BMG5.11 TaxID=222540 RepID=UPI00103C6137|nr:hypothetical protein [Parafrankia sp. BMG5.11]